MVGGEKIVKRLKGGEESVQKFKCSRLKGGEKEIKMDYRVKPDNDGCRVFLLSHYSLFTIHYYLSTYNLITLSTYHRLSSKLKIEEEFNPGKSLTFNE